MTDMHAGSRTILLVDDDDDFRQVVAHWLERAGWNVRQAADGQEALEEAQRHPPDLVLLDLYMPRMNGWECAHRLREQHGMRVPIVVMSGEAGSQAAQELGASGYLQKASRPAQLLEVVSRVLAPQSGGHTQ